MARPGLTRSDPGRDNTADGSLKPVDSNGKNSGVGDW